MRGNVSMAFDLLRLRVAIRDSRWEFQCRRIGEPITEKAIRAEIEKARGLEPNLTELIFATTLERDAKIQAVEVFGASQLFSRTR